jgi:nucleoside-diphosphate-sugar epimerase
MDNIAMMVTLIDRHAASGCIMAVMQERGSERKKRIVISGATGIIGQTLMEGLSREYEVVGVDAAVMPGIIHADLSEKEGIHEFRRHALGSDAVIHLAWDTEIASDDREGQEQNKLIAETVFCATREVGVRRFIFASSVHVCFGAVGYERGVIVGEHAALHGKKMTVVDGVSPISAYGREKAYLEALFGGCAVKRIGVIAIRFGNVTRDDSHGEYPFWLSHRDCQQFVRRCIEAESLPPFTALFAVSDNACNPFDLSEAQRMIGYEPQDGAPCPLGKTK